MKRAYNAIAAFFVGGLFLLPNISLGGGVPLLRSEDLAVYLMTLVLIFNIKRPLPLSKGLAAYLFYISLFAVWILACMLGNGRFFVLRDYFEYYKLFKYAVIIVFVCLLLKDQAPNGWEKLAVPIFGLLLVFNVLNYLNLFNFNKWVMPFYADSARLAGFGLDSLGRSAPKRLLGVMGNPNNNAILWSFFAAYFLSAKKNLWVYLFFLVSVTMVMLTGSKTAALALLAMLLVNWQLQRFSLKSAAIVLTSGGMMLGAVALFNISYISNLWNTDLAGNLSLMKRLEIWEHLAEMIRRSPWIGYGPNKDYFYQNHLYSESEYFLMAWRYGLIGLVMYLGQVLIPVIHGWRYRSLPYPKMLILFSVIILLAAFSNNPLTDARFLALYAALCGLSYHQIREHSDGALRQ
ncbi:MAG: O-antigen ligase family protein [Candidatus Edwardsbacteria bacterium]|nr:O-antigen ligase family protein [Candidatus Edwardsbacteria bacterium]